MTDIDIQIIASQFENKTLPKEQWTHKEHLAVAFVQIDKYKSIAKALAYMRTNIKEYNISVGTNNTESSGYHETLTIFWLKIVYEYYLTKNNIVIEEIYKSFIKTILASTKLPTKFYSKDLLFSKSARQIWTEPDLISFTKIRAIISQNIEKNFTSTDQDFEEQFAKIVTTNFRTE